MITKHGENIEPSKDSIQFFDTRLKDHLFKCSATLIADAHGEIVGSVCLNYDISDLLPAHNAIQSFVQYPAAEPAEQTQNEHPLLTKNVDDILQYYIQQAEAMAGKPMSLMSREEKQRLWII